MRLFEIIIVILNFFTLIAFVIPVKFKHLWFRIFPVLAVLFMLLHLFLEEYRWQMFPSYLLTTIFFIISIISLLTLSKQKRKSPPLSWKILKVTAITLGFLAISISIVPLILFPIFKLPIPHGPYAVGTRFLYYTDLTRPDLHTEEKDDFRSISLQIWYPAEKSKINKTIPYMSREAAICWANAWNIEPDFLLTHFSLVQTHSYLNAKSQKGSEPFPVILFSPSGNMSYNTALFEELSSQGFVVFCVGHPHWFPYRFKENGGILCSDSNDPYYQSLWEEENLEIVNETREALTVAKNHEEKLQIQKKLNSLMPLEVADISLWVDDYISVINAIEQINKPGGVFNSMLDLDRMAVMGLSKGGAAAGQFCIKDSRCKAGVNLGGFMFGDVAERHISQPFLFLEHVEPWCEDCLAVNEHIYNCVENSAYMVRIEGAKHFNFTDLSLAGPFLRMIGLVGHIDGSRMLEIQNRYVIAFFNKHLKGLETPLLTGKSVGYSEVKYSVRHP